MVKKLVSRALSVIATAAVPHAVVNELKYVSALSK